MNVYQVIANVLDVDPASLNDESNAQNTPNWDSLRHIEVIFAVESAFHVRFSMPEIMGLRKLGDIREVLSSKGVETDVQEPQQIAV